MKITKKRIYIIVAFVLCLVFLLIAILGSENAIESRVLRQAPIGTDKQEFFEIVQKNNWIVWGETDWIGLIKYYEDTYRLTPFSQLAYDDGTVRRPTQDELIGVSAARIILDEYKHTGDRSIDLYVAFDENDRLCFVKAKKSYNLL